MSDPFQIIEPPEDSQAEPFDEPPIQRKELHLCAFQFVQRDGKALLKCVDCGKELEL